MTVRIRLQRFGRRNKPFYRVVVADSRAPRNGKFIELVGTYNPLATRSGIKEVTFNVDRVRYWVSVGAQPSDRVAWLLGQFGILPPKVVPVARVKRTVPRKEWKEKQKMQEGKGFHTSAASLSPTGVATPVALALGDEFSPRVFSELLPGGDILAGWLTGSVETGGLGPSSSVGVSEFQSAISAGVSSWPSAGSDDEETSPEAERSPLYAVLAAHLGILGPAAFARMSSVLLGAGNRDEPRTR